ncbi:MAG TPA: anaerobic ribonucleoside-triphosphate reductase activating protein [Anaerovoracaceae bacterium]|nr:anaerobic ribonucleoside-triphosphate reductase activating protein [Anaerovoracaceae bacterium]
MIEERETVRIAGIVRESIVDGPGIRFVVFAQGCPHGCPKCHNEETHDFEGGYDCSIEKILNAVAENPLLAGVTFSGGEPVCQPEAFYSLAKKLKEQSPDLNLILYSGYSYEELSEMCKSNEALAGLLGLTDLLIDGKYEDELRDLRLLFRGSSNQRIIDMAATEATGEIVLADKYY